MTVEQFEEFIKLRIEAIEAAVKEDATKLETNLHTHDVPEWVKEKIAAHFGKKTPPAPEPVEQIPEPVEPPPAPVAVEEPTA